jgi:hypothetical protein
MKKVVYKVFKMKKPKEKDFKPKKHNWILDSNGEINEFKYDGDYHNGPECLDCGYSECMHCVDVYKKTDCLYREALKNYHKKMFEVENYNKKAKIINDYLENKRILK